VPLIKAAMAHKGFAFIDIVSPCVTFNNNDGSTKSYDYMREHSEALAEIGYVPEKEEIKVFYETGSSTQVEMHDGSTVLLNKLADGWNPRDRNAAVNRLQKAKEANEILTGLIYIDTDSQDLHTVLNTTQQPLNTLAQTQVCPGAAVLAAINDDHR
jgi:2-oxoglutarate/2-oxoacid ferredoxin oxidoreductase subunit beta